jgi:hypothetical protein
MVIDRSSATVRVESEPDNDKKATEEKPIPRFLRPEWVIVYITAIYVLISWLTLWAIKRQADAMDQQVADARKSSLEAALTATGTLEEMKLQRLQTVSAMNKQAYEIGEQTSALRGSVAAAKASADAAKLSADIAVGVSIPTLKIVEFEAINLAGLTAEQFFQSPRVAITIKNYGQTPAFLEWWSLCFTCEDLPDIPVYDGPASGMPLKSVAVQPGSPHNLPAVEFFRTPTFSSEEVQAIIKREKLLTAYGFICYSDLFNHPLQRFKFCKTVLNIFHDEQICDWWGEFAPPAYRGVDQMPYRETKEQKAENPN